MFHLRNVSCYSPTYGSTKTSGVFTNWTKLAIMPILASEALLCENKKKSSDNMLPPVRLRPKPLMNLLFQVQHSPF